jgi:ABC-type transporter Mla maintaining outer membrane lipid asymmetry ATPase subunit MlaF
MVEAPADRAVRAATGAELRVRGLRLGIEPGAALDFQLRTGEILVVLGRNGSGKSLLVNLLSGIYPVEPGVVCFGADDLGRAAGLRRIRQRTMGVVFQKPALLRSLTIFENLALPLRLARRRSGVRWWRNTLPLAVIREELAYLLALVGVPACEDLFPHELSAGDQQCVALARALAGDKRVLLCDEPTADLSPDKAFQIDELIAGLVRGGLIAAAVICTQSLDTAFRLGTRFLLLGDGADLGRAEACASAAELRALPAFQRLLRIPAESLFWDEDATHLHAAAGARQFGL